MKRTLFLLALLAVSAAPAAAQEATEFGVLVGGSRRFVWGGEGARSITPDESDWIESNFLFSNTSFELYWSMPIEPELNLKFKGGRIESEIAIPYRADDPTTPASDPNTLFRKDVANGEVQHIEAVVEYEFDEPFGSSGLFAGAGFYRLSASGEETQQSYGVTAGVNTDFPITRRYGVILEAAYHWLPALEFNPRYLTVSGGMRVSF